MVRPIESKRAEAEALLKKRDEQIVTARVKAQREEAAKTARLRELRLAKEAEDRQFAKANPKRSR